MADVLLAIRVDEKGAIKSIENVAGSMDKLADKSKKSEDSLKKLSSTMGGEASNLAQQYAGKLGALGDAAMAFGPHGLAAAAAIGAVTAAATASIAALTQYASRIEDLSGQTGLSAAALQRFDYAARLTGTTLEAFTGASVKLSKALEDTPEKFNRLGLSVLQLQQMTPDKQFEAVAAAIQKLDSPTKQAAAAMDIFGKSAAVLLPAIKEGLGGLGDEAERVGGVLSDDMVRSGAKLGDEFDRLGKSWEIVKLAFGAFLVDGLKLDEVFGLITKAVGNLTAELNKLGSSRGAEILTQMMLRSQVFGAAGLLGGVAALAAGGSSGPATGGSTMTPATGTSAWREHYLKTMGGEMTVDGTSALKTLNTEQKRAADAAKKLSEAHIKLYSVGMTLADRVNAGIAGANSWQRFSTQPLSLADRVNAGMNKPPEVPSIWGDRLGTSLADRVNAGLRKAFQPSIFADLAKSLPGVILGAVQGGGNVGGAVGSAIGGGIGTKLGDALGKKLGGALGGALGSAVPIVGTLIGGFLGSKLGGLFGDGGKKKRQDEALQTYLPQLEQLSGQIDQLLRQTMEAGASGLAAVFAHMGDSADLTADKLARMGAVGYSMFQALRAQGYGTLDAMKLLGPAIDAAIQAAIDAGLELTGTFKELADFQQRLGENEGLIKAIDGASAALAALATSGKLTLADFNTLQAASQDYFKQLTDAGFTAAQALEIMAPYLYNLADAAKRYGFELDATTQEQIRLAEEAGLFEDMQSPMEKLVELQGLMLLAIAALVKAFGKDLPDSVQAYIDKLNKIPKIPGAPGTPGGGAPEEPDPGKNGHTPGYASGGYIPATPGGRVIRVAEGGEGEYIVPASKMHGGAGGGVTLNYSPVVNLSGVRIEDADDVAEKVGAVLEQERTRLPGLLREYMRDEMRAQGVL